MSKRCFLNVLTQLCDKETLLNANYYIADQKSPDGTVDFVDRMSFDENGQLVTEYAPAQSYASTVTSLGLYNIKYDNALDPTNYCTSLMNGNRGEYHDPHEMFIKHLNDSSTLTEVYQFLFKMQPKGNGIQIVIFRDEANVKDFGHIICQYLSRNFGADIMFLDPKYRPDVPGYTDYHGDKVYAANLIKRIRDMELLIAFNKAVTVAGYDEGINNIMAHLSTYNFYQLIYLYNLLFPNDPLPPDNYTVEQIMGIIASRAMASIPRNKPLQNLYMTDDFMKHIERYNQEANGYNNDDDF